jgi:hypothetical protein
MSSLKNSITALDQQIHEFMRCYENSHDVWVSVYRSNVDKDIYEPLTRLLSEMLNGLSDLDTAIDHAQNELDSLDF